MNNIIIPNLIYPSVNQENKPTPSEVFNLDDFWKRGEHIAGCFSQQDDGSFHFLLNVKGEKYGFEFTPAIGSELEFICQLCDSSNTVSLDVYRRRLDGFLMPRVRGVSSNVR
jgi:hypothetical protein